MIEFIIFWVVCSVLSYGASFAYFQRRYPLSANMDYWKDLKFCLGMSLLLSPVWLVVTVANNDKFEYGFKFK